MRARTAALTALALALALVLAPAPGAGAAPTKPKPSAAQVAAARHAAAVAAQSLAAARTAQAAAQARLDALDTRVEVLVEAWDAAKADADSAAAAAELASTEAMIAQGAATLAQRQVDQLAAQSYQVGADLSGGLGEWAAVVDSAFTSTGIAGLTERIAALGQVSADRRQQAVETSALRLAALQAQQSAVRASDDLAARLADAQRAADAVKAQEKAQAAEVAQLTAQRNAAVATLASARSTATQLAQQRADALRREAAARAAAAAAAAAAARRARLGGRSPADAGGSTTSTPSGSSVTTAAQREAAVAWARTQFGKPYVAGADGPDSYDCSGLTSAAYRTVGVSLVHFSQSQYAAGLKVPVSALRPGDLVFFATNPNDWRTIHHVGIYAGGGQMIEAPHTGDVVKYMTIWQSELVPFGARP